MAILDLGQMSPRQTMALAARCFAELTPADCVSVILAQYPDLDELIEELQTEANLRADDAKAAE